MERVQDKLLKAFDNADPEYVRSAQFKNVLSKETKAIISDREPWCNIKIIMDELKSNKLLVSRNYDYKCSLKDVV